MPTEPLDLATHPLFTGVPPDILDLARKLARPRFYRHGDVVFRQGDPPDHLFLILHGEVRIVAAAEVHLVTRRAPEIIGEQAFINDALRSATAVAQGATRILALPKDLVRRLLENATFTRNLLRIVSEKLADSTCERELRFRQEELLFAEFGAHVSPEVRDQLLATGERYGDPRYIDAVILFSDIRSFTERSAGMDPDELARQLGPYLDRVVDVIHQHKGLVDKFVGDAVMAIWGFASAEGCPAVQALTCAREMVEVAGTMTFGGEPIHIGVGLNAGRVFIGNVGGLGKRQFTVLGMPVNLAARFESETKELKVPIVVGHDFLERLPECHRRGFTAFSNRPIKGAQSQTVYGFDPRTEDNQGDE